MGGGEAAHPGRIHTTLTRALNWAQRRGKVYRNVSDLVETPVGTHRPSKAPTVAQVQTVLDTAQDDRLQALWTLGLILGMRPGELTGLRWEDVAFDTGVISVSQSLKHNRGRIRTLIGGLFHVGYTVEGTGKLLRQHGWSCQVPVRQAMERDDEAVAVWKAEVWPQLKAPRATWAPSSASRTRQARG